MAHETPEDVPAAVRSPKPSGGKPRRAGLTDAVLLVTASGLAESCASLLTGQLGLAVELAAGRRQALAALRRREFAVVVLDEGMAEADPAGAEVLWQQAGLAVPVQVNFAISGCNRVLREVRGAIQRREREVSLALRAATRVLEGEINTALTGLLLEAELALREPGLPAAASARMTRVLHLAGTLRQQLRGPGES
jgi:DNA-binding NtrC family response regulator